jgi:hypothetical protein
MRALLLLGTIGLGLSFSAIGACAASAGYQAVTAFSTISQQVQSVDPLAHLIEGRSAFTSDSDGRVLATESHSFSGTLREDVGKFVGNAILLGVVALVFGLSAVGAKALWVLDPTEYTPFGDRPY